MSRSADLPSFAHVLRARAAETPDRATFTFLGDDDGDCVSMTDGEADRRARGIGALLQSYGFLHDRVLVVCPPGLDFIAAFYGCLYAGDVAVPVYPPGPAAFGRGLAHLEAIVHDARPRCLLTTRTLLAARKALVAAAPSLGELRWFAVDEPVRDVEGQWKSPPIDRDDLAVLQYTSGSTGAPKGVMISHGNLLHNCEQMRRRLRGGPNDRHVAWLPPYHDMGLIAGILMVSHFGMTVTLMSPLTVMKRPYRWLKAVSDTRATVTGGAPFGFDLAARKISDAELAALDLGSVRVACIAAEPVRAATLDRFVDRFGPVGFARRAFLPCYGLAESTLMATGGVAEADPVTRVFARDALRSDRVDDAAERPAGDRVTLVANGPVIDDMELRIVDAATCRTAAPRALGEIWLSGPSVAQGYWGRPEETTRVFGATLADGEDAPRSGARFLRTGDVGAVVDGELYVTGRIKDVLIVRGVKHHPEDLEATVEGAHPALRAGGAVVFSADDATEERIVVMHEVDTRGLDGAAVARAVRHVVALVHGVEVGTIVLVRARTLPRTTSGKTRRHAARAAFLEGNLPGAVFTWRRVSAAEIDARPPCAGGSAAVVAGR